MRARQYALRDVYLGLLLATAPGLLLTRTGRWGCVCSERTFQDDLGTKPLSTSRESCPLNVFKLEILTVMLSLRNIAATTAGYLSTLVFYRLFLHPPTKFPSPKLAAIARYYEGYFDLLRNGQHTFKIAELHKKYGLTLFLVQSLPSARF